MRAIALLVVSCAVGCGGRVLDDASTDAGADVLTVRRDAGADARRDTGTPPPDPSGCVVPDDPSPAATESWGGACNEGQNTSYPIEDNCGGGSVAWEYVPKHDLLLKRLELNVTGGGVALFDSDCDRPGKQLFEGSFGGRGPRSWRGADVSPPIPLEAGHAYYIEQITPQGTSDVCSAAKGGAAQRQFNPPGFGGGSSWTGPYIWLNWTAHVIGDCM